MGAKDDISSAITNTRPSETQAAIAAGELLERHRTTPKRAPDFLHGKPFIILRNADGSERVEYVTEQMINPTFREGAVALADGPSFISYFNDHKVAGTSAIYASLNPLGFAAVLDEHRANQEGNAAWREFRASFQPKLSREWNLWMGHNGANKPFNSTEEFAYFIEDNAPDFVKPSAAEMMEMALNFRVKQAANYRAVTRLQDGNVEFQYANVVEASAGAPRTGDAGGSIRIPEEFEISIPIFEGLSEPPQTIRARFRYRLQSGHLVLWYELIRAHKVLEESFKRLVADVQEGTETQILVGTTD